MMRGLEIRHNFNAVRPFDYEARTEGYRKNYLLVTLDCFFSWSKKNVMHLLYI